MRMKFQEENPSRTRDETIIALKVLHALAAGRCLRAEARRSPRIARALHAGIAALEKTKRGSPCRAPAFVDAVLRCPCRPISRYVE
ncbi:MAG: hypothetical protein WDO13_09165 [Verrucomicrobiota bacterium]